MGDRLVDLSPAGQGQAEAVVGDRVFCRAGHRAGPQRLAVAPKGRLPPRTAHQDRHHQHRRNAAHPTAIAAKTGRRPRLPRPRRCTVQSAASRYSGRPSPALPPAPARSPAPASPDTTANRRADTGTAAARPATPREMAASTSTAPATFQAGRRGSWMGIQHRQTRRAKELAQIGNVRDHGIADPPGQGTASIGCNGLALGQERRHAGSGRQGSSGIFSTSQRSSAGKRPWPHSAGRHRSGRLPAIAIAQAASSPTAAAQREASPASAWPSAPGQTAAPPAR